MLELLLQGRLWIRLKARGFSGGTWIDTATVNMAFLFEVNLHGVRGFGLGASAAIDNWIANAETVVASDETAIFTKDFL